MKLAESSHYWVANGFTSYETRLVDARVEYVVEPNRDTYLYEALLIRRDSNHKTIGYFSLGEYEEISEAEEVIEEVIYEGYYKKLNAQYYEELKNV